MGDFSLNPLKVFTENRKTYRSLAKPVSVSKVPPIRFSFSVKFVNNAFDNFNNIYYYFLLSRAAIESHPGKQLNKKHFATNQLHWHFFKVLLEFCTYFTIFRRVQQEFSAHSLLESRVHD